MIGAVIAVLGRDGAGGYEGTQGFMESMGVPGMLLPLVIVLELGGGLALLAGFQTRIVALALAGFCVLTAVIFHTDFGDRMQMILFMKNIALTGGFLVLIAHGAGAYSLDNRGKQSPAESRP